MPSFQSFSVILKEYDYSEADRIIVFFTEARGKLRAVAKGVRKARSRLRACTSLLSLSEIQFYGKEHQNLYLVTQGQLVTSFSRLKLDLQLLGQAARACELVDRLTPEQQPLPEIFRLLRMVLELMEEGISHRLAGIWFETAFLDKVGYRPNLSHCTVCNQDQDHMAYVPERGGVVCRACSSQSTLSVSRGTRILMEKLRRLGPAGIRRLRLPYQAESEMSALLNAAFQFQLGRTLNSDKFQKAVQKVETRQTKK